MAKLYAELTSDKGGRVVGKGGDECITVRFKNKNIACFDITFTPGTDILGERGSIEIMNYRGQDNTLVIDYMDDLQKLK